MEGLTAARKSECSKCQKMSEEQKLSHHQQMLTVWWCLLRRDMCTADRKSHEKQFEWLLNGTNTRWPPTCTPLWVWTDALKICGLKLHQKLKCSIPSTGEETQRLSTAVLESHHSISILSWHQREYPKAISASHHKHHRAKLWSSLRPKPWQYKSCKILSGVCCLILSSVSDGSISSLCCEESIWESYIPGFTVQLKTKVSLSLQMLTNAFAFIMYVSSPLVLHLIPFLIVRNAI